MPAPTADLLNRLGPETRPFERQRPPRRSVVAGEDTLFDQYIFDATEGGLPLGCVKLPVSEINRQPKTGLYLWVIDKTGLKILLEATPNPDARRGVVCHTNITGGEPALQGGELWFGDDGKVYINYQSGRYGAATAVQETAVLDYFITLGYDIVRLPPR